MPLIKGKGKEAFSGNVKAEVSAGKPVKQAVAIAYSEKKKAEHRKKMWRGGEAQPTGMSREMVHKAIAARYHGKGSK